MTFIQSNRCREREKDILNMAAKYNVYISAHLLEDANLLISTSPSDGRGRFYQSIEPPHHLHSLFGVTVPVICFESNSNIAVYVIHLAEILGVFCTIDMPLVLIETRMYPHLKCYI